MSNQFGRYVDKMPGLLDKLRAGEALDRDSLRTAPEHGVYVMYENDVPMYVGRSNRLPNRLLEHSRPSSKHNSAPFAFNLAREEAKKRGINLTGLQRTQIEKLTEFNQLFMEAKSRVGAMKIRAVEITNPIEQTLFEVYAALDLKTQYNDFDTH